MKQQPLIALSLGIALALCAAFMAPLPAGMLHGVVLAGSGALLIYFRPCRPLPRRVVVAGAVLFVTTLAGFLPASWFGIPEWRTYLASSGVVKLGTLVSTQPEHTLAGCFLLAASMATGLFLLTQTPDAKCRTWLAAAFAFGAAAYAALSYFAKVTGWVYPGTALNHVFGFFPNKNHTANFLMLGGFASMGAFAQWVNKRRFAEAAGVAAAGAVTVTTLVTQCDSRAGVLFFALGSLLWLAWITRRGFEKRVIVWCWVAAILVSTVLFASDSLARVRLAALASHAVSKSSEINPSGLMPTPEAATEQVEPAEDTLDFRILIWRDTFAMIRAQPLVGVGIGNFRYVFPQFRNASRTEALCLHPESSLLQLAAEAGLPALAALLWLLAAVVAGTGVRASSRAWLARSALAAGAAMFLLHCCVDVPGTRVGTLWPAMVVAALALSPDPWPKAEGDPSPGGISCFAYIGLLMLGAGLWLLGGGLDHAPWTGPAAGFRMQQQVYYTHRAGYQEEALALATEAVRTSPLEPEFYFQAGTLELQFANTGPVVDSLYLAERLIEPIKTKTPMQQAAYWMKVNPRKALPLFSDALRRASLLPVSTNFTPREDVYAQALQLVAGKPELRDNLRDLAAGEPAMLLLWLKAAPPGNMDADILQILRSDPRLSGWDDNARRSFFRLWYDSGDRRQLLDTIRRTPEWDAAGWPFLALDAANQNAFEAACTIIFKHIQAPSEPEITPQSQEPEETGLYRSRYEDRPTAASAEALSRAYYREQDFDAVLQFAGEARAAGIGSPAVSALAYQAAARQGRWDMAWQWAEDFVRRTDPTAAPE